MIPSQDAFEQRVGPRKVRRLLSEQQPREPPGDFRLRIGQRLRLWGKRANGHFEGTWKNVIFLSATPGPYELEKCTGEIVEQVIRPTGLVDPRISVKPARGQVPDLLHRIAERAAVHERVLVTTLTKRLAEDLSGYIKQEGLKGEYLHSEIDTLERVQILRDLRRGVFDVLVGINLLREGLDLPETSSSSG